MKRGLLLLVLFLGWCGCNLFKNIKTTTDQSHHLNVADTNVKVTEEKNLKTQSNKLILFKDSGNAQYTVQIWPKGVFTYSADKGFAGAAEKLQIVETISSGSSYADRSRIQQQDKGKASASLTIKKKSEEAQQVKVKEISPSWKWIAGSLAFMSILGLTWYLYHKLT